MKVFIGILSYDGSVDADCMASVIRNIMFLHNRKYEVHFHIEKGCCYLPMARNRVVQVFLASGCDRLVFVDADLRFEDDAIFKLLSKNKHIVAGAYPFKVGKDGYPVHLFTNKDGTPVVEDGLLKVYFAPTGLMSIRKEVFEVMRETHPEWGITSDAFCYFDTGNLWNDGLWHGEDVAFCRRWLDLSGNVWIEPNIHFGHIGKRETTGNYHEYLLKCPQPKQDK